MRAKEFGSEVFMKAIPCNTIAINNQITGHRIAFIAIIVIEWQPTAMNGNSWRILAINKQIEILDNACKKRKNQENPKYQFSAVLETM